MRLLITLALLVSLVACKSPAQDPNLELVVSTELFRLEVDKTTRSEARDNDGDLIVTELFKLTPAEHAEMGGMKIRSFFNAVSGMCGYDTIIILASAVETVEGEYLIQQPGKPSFYKNYGDPNSVVTHAYRRLCGDVKSVPRNMFEGVTI